MHQTDSMIWMAKKNPAKEVEPFLEKTESFWLSHSRHQLFARVSFVFWFDFQEIYDTWRSFKRHHHFGHHNLRWSYKFQGVFRHLITPARFFSIWPNISAAQLLTVAILVLRPKQSPLLSQNDLSAFGGVYSKGRAQFARDVVGAPLSSPNGFLPGWLLWVGLTPLLPCFLIIPLIPLVIGFASTSFAQRLRQ